MFDPVPQQATIKTVGTHQFYLFPSRPHTLINAIVLPRMRIRSCHALRGNGFQWQRDAASRSGRQCW